MNLFCDLTLAQGNEQRFVIAAMNVLNVLAANLTNACTQEIDQRLIHKQSYLHLTNYSGRQHILKKYPEDVEAKYRSGPCMENTE